MYMAPDPREVWRPPRGTRLERDLGLWSGRSSRARFPQQRLAECYNFRAQAVNGTPFLFFVFLLAGRPHASIPKKQRRAVNNLCEIYSLKGSLPFKTERTCNLPRDSKGRHKRQRGSGGIRLQPRS